MAFSDRINTAMEHARFSQKLLADKIGVSQQAIQAITSGKSERSAYTVEIALACQVDPVWLALGTGRMTGHAGASSVGGQAKAKVEDEAWVEIILQWVFEMQEEMGLELPTRLQAGWTRTIFTKFRQEPLPDLSNQEQVGDFKREAKSMLKNVT